MPRSALTRNRSSLLHKVGYVLRNPGKVPSHARRTARDAWLRVKHPDHVSYYRAIMAADTARGADSAVGSSKGRESWLRIGQWQFDYLRGHGLTPQDRMLEIGCGNLRAGWRFIQYLDAGNYYGIDISPDILMAAKQTLVQYRLQDKVPYLTVNDNLTFDFLPDRYFDVVHAHSVFSHTPLHFIDECFAHVGRILAPEGFFDFTFDRTTRREHHVLGEDFYYRTETLMELARKHGLQARFMEDWEKLPHGQSKMRVTHASDHTAVLAGRGSAR
jgi:ubiquinone/menaquinone biosynthesis C-methylase UbiE